LSTSCKSSYVDLIAEAAIERVTRVL
ncbi:unnamed protein product, partial [Didymodactylos carnosus]